MDVTTSPTRTPGQIRRWRQYLADERSEAAGYRKLAERRTGEERDILLALADAEKRHESHWLELLGDDVGPPRRSSLRTRLLVFLAAHFGSVFVLALMQRAEGRSPYETDVDATDRMAADERIHGEVLRGLAARGRQRLSGTFRAAVFGANDGLVSNLALVLGIGATGVDAKTILFTGLAGLLAGALSMAAGEYVSVRSQRELLQSTQPDPESQSALPHLDVDANELALVYRARGMQPPEAEEHARTVLATLHLDACRAGDGRSRPARGSRLGLERGGLQLLLLRVRRPDTGAAVSVRGVGVGRGGDRRRPGRASRCSAPVQSSASCPAPRPSSGRCASSGSATAPRRPRTCWVARSVPPSADRVRDPVRRGRIGCQHA